MAYHSPGPVGETKPDPALTKPDIIRTVFDRKDLAIMILMSLLYAAIALVNLGSLNVPRTPWNPKAGASFVVDLGREVNLTRISYYCGLGRDREARGRYRVENADDPNTPVPIGVLEKDTVFAWRFIDISARARKIRFVADSTDGTINEAGLFEAGSRVPVRGIRIAESAPGSGNVESLFDEQDKVSHTPSYLNSAYFDEIYFARTAYEHLHRMEPFETVHPPLGKILIAIGVAVFGMNPFGWRIAGALFGVAMIPLMYAFGKKLFEQRIFAFCSSFLMMFDFMHFTQTRISTVDVYGVFFVILMYYFMFDCCINRSYALGFRQSLRPLFLSGLFFGIGTACKWITLYGGAGLAVLLFLSKYREYRDYSHLVRDNRSDKPAWVKDYVPVYLAGTVLFCLLFFIVLPGLIYVLSYIPIMMVPGPGHGLKDVFSMQSFMYDYHSTLKATHPFSSPWYEWPFMIKPTWFYAGAGLEPGRSSTIVTMGNPAVWWVGVIAVFAALVVALKERNRKMLVVFVALAFQYLPWTLVPRITYIYHFFSSVPFVILCIVYVIRYFVVRDRALQYFMWAYLIIVAGLFVLFYPVMSGMEVSSGYINSLKLLKGWLF
ncbi:MAG TPA: glycosyltransferase family 39 protein [Thermodesulfovibrionales bacterium]|nr:glycosyltransferase family 39 protein [Thermodesulfovibrionales bacterium]